MHSTITNDKDNHNREEEKEALEEKEMREKERRYEAKMTGTDWNVSLNCAVC